MRKTMKLLVLLGAVAPFLLWSASSATAGSTNGAAAAAAVTADGLFTNTLVAKGKGVSVSRSKLDEELIRIKSLLAAQGRPLPDDAPTVERQVLDDLISRQLLLSKSTEADKAKAKVQFEASLQKFKIAGKLTDEEFNQRLNQQLRIQDLTRQQWEQQSIERAMLPIVLQRELKIDITTDEARKFYDENPAKFEQPEAVRAAHILISTRSTDPDAVLSGGRPKTTELSDDQKAAKKKLAEDLLKRARAGEDFAKLAKEYSEDPGSKDNGGEYTFPRGQMMPEFEAAAFSLNTNQISDIVTTTYGYHIIKLYEKIPAKKMDFDKEASDIKDYLAQREIQKQFPAYVQGLRKDAGVQILDERLKSVELPAPSDTGGAAKAPGTAP
ncbi:MAG: peptidylprolyl isomerase [Verrucomicrobiota bacterium]